MFTHNNIEKMFYLNLSSFFLDDVKIQSNYFPFNPETPSLIEKALKTELKILFDKYKESKNEDYYRALIIGVYIISILKNELVLLFVQQSCTRNNIIIVENKVDHKVKTKNNFNNLFEFTSVVIRKWKRKITRYFRYKFFRKWLYIYDLNRTITIIDYVDFNQESVKFIRNNLSKRVGLVDLTRFSEASTKQVKYGIENIVNDSVKELLCELSTIYYNVAAKFELIIDRQIDDRLKQKIESHFRQVFTIFFTLKEDNLFSGVKNFYSGALNTVIKRALADKILSEGGEVHVKIHGHPFVHMNDTFSWLDLPLSSHFYVYSELAKDCFNKVIEKHPTPNDNQPQIRILNRNIHKGNTTNILYEFKDSKGLKKLFFFGGLTSNIYQVNSYVKPSYFNAYIERQLLLGIKKFDVIIEYKNRPEWTLKYKENAIFFHDIKNVKTITNQLKIWNGIVVLYDLRSTALVEILRTKCNIIYFDLGDNKLCCQMKDLLEKRIYFIKSLFNEKEMQYEFDWESFEASLTDPENKTNNYFKICNSLL